MKALSSLILLFCISCTQQQEEVDPDSNKSLEQREEERRTGSTIKEVRPYRPY